MVWIPRQRYLDFPRWIDVVPAFSGVLFVDHPADYDENHVTE